MSASLVPAARSVLLVDDDARRAERTLALLREFGIANAFLVHQPSRILKSLTEFVADLILVDLTAPEREVFNSLRFIAEHRPTPVVMYGNEGKPEVITQAIDAGVTLYLVGRLDRHPLKPTIEVALAQFRRDQELRRELESIKRELADSRAVDEAKRLLMRTANLSESQAYADLRSQAMACGATLAEVAQRLLKLNRHTRC